MDGKSLWITKLGPGEYQVFFKKKKKWKLRLLSCILSWATTLLPSFSCSDFTQNFNFKYTLYMYAMELQMYAPLAHKFLSFYFWLILYKFIQMLGNFNYVTLHFTWLIKLWFMYKMNYYYFCSFTCSIFIGLDQWRIPRQQFPNSLATKWLKGL